MKISKSLIFTLLIVTFFISNPLSAQNKAFKCIVLGNGSSEGNLSSFMLADLNSNNYICLDAGTLINGIHIALKEKSFGKFKPSGKEKLNPETYILQNYIKGYLISNTQMNHIAALVANAPNDNRKFIYGIPQTIENMNNHIFNWKIASNFTNEGEGVALKKYKYAVLQQGIDNQLFETNLTVTAFNLSSNHMFSTAFLIKSNENYFLYFGNTGADVIEESNSIADLWRIIAPLIKEKKLNAIMIGCYYTNEQADEKLYGQLKPDLLNKELNQLAKLINDAYPEQALKGLKVFIKNIKPSVSSDENTTNQIKNQLENGNNINVRYMFPEQGERIEF